MRRFYVGRSFRRNRIGLALAENLLYDARALGRPVTVNAAARSELFWQSLGFVSEVRNGHTNVFPNVGGQVDDLCIVISIIRNIAHFALHTSGRWVPAKWAAGWTKEASMADGLSPRPPGRARGRPFEKGRSGNPAGRRTGCRNKANIAAVALLEGEPEAPTRKAVERALIGDPTAMRLCVERILPPCRERTVNFALPPIESAPTGPSPSAKGPRYRRRDEGGDI
jgi:uncharacterized protein DUF5681